MFGMTPTVRRLNDPYARTSVQRSAQPIIRFHVASCSSTASGTSQVCPVASAKEDIILDDQFRYPPTATEPHVADI